jgi:hypothetical protein
MLDWSKPIMHRNGQPLELLETWPDGSPNFPEKTRVVRRPNEDCAEASIWWFGEDGKAGLTEFDVVNRTPAGRGDG